MGIRVLPFQGSVLGGAAIAVRLAKEIAQAQDRRLVYESAFPVGPKSLSRRGVPGMTWVLIDQATYDTCRDPRDYRPRRQ